MFVFPVCKRAREFCKLGSPKRDSNSPCSGDSLCKTFFGADWPALAETLPPPRVCKSPQAQAIHPAVRRYCKPTCTGRIKGGSECISNVLNKVDEWSTSPARLSLSGAAAEDRRYLLSVACIDNGGLRAEHFHQGDNQWPRLHLSAVSCFWRHASFLFPFTAWRIEPQTPAPSSSGVIKELTFSSSPGASGSRPGDNLVGGCFP